MSIKKESWDHKLRHTADSYYTANAALRPSSRLPHRGRCTRSSVPRNGLNGQTHRGLPVRRSRSRLKRIHPILRDTQSYTFHTSWILWLNSYPPRLQPKNCCISHHILQKIPYPTLRRAFSASPSFGSKEPLPKRLKMEAHSQNIADDIDEWILSNEKYLAHTERRGVDWRRGLVGLADADAMFPPSIRYNLARTITQAINLPGYEVLGGERQSKVHIQPSVVIFKKTFDRMSDGLLKTLDWNNVFVAGGIVLGTLFAVKTSAAISQPAARWKNSDIDVYVYGLAPTDANKKIQHIFETFRKSLPAGNPTLVVRNSKTITLYSRYPLRRIQIVLKLVTSPKSVLLNFDLDICAMGWNGTELWMLPRAARALETGFNVFTMNLIQGHYLSERRASQEQRPSPKGYGIRILRSYMDSLEGSKAKLDKISRGEHLFDLDLNEIAEKYKRWHGPGFTFSHLNLENDHQLSAEPQGYEPRVRRHPHISGHLDFSSLHSPSYDIRYTWDEDFDVDDFENSINDFNRAQITNWLEPYNGQLPAVAGEFVEDSGPIEHACRLSYGYDMRSVLQPQNDITMPLLLPLNFAAFANHIVGQAQAAAGLKVEKILTPAIKTDTKLHVALDSENATLGLFIWRIGKELMWQQLDRVFEALYAFHRAHDRLQRDERETQIRLVTQLSKRAIRTTVEDEFDAFARWVGRKPIAVTKFFNDSVKLRTMDDHGGGSDQDDYGFEEPLEWV
ncbi:hypothetical protein DFH09DRAFT_1269645 [Mycena vulgaris]|nr:hypothetical protein DFH09DRAFT_1269645 [Mycena vulgaris]